MNAIEPKPKPVSDWWLGLGLSTFLAGWSYGLAAAPVISLLGALCLALLLGMIWRSCQGTIPEDLSGVRFASKTPLRLGIVLMGVRLHVDYLVAAGPSLLSFTVGLVLFNLLFVIGLSRQWGLSPSLGALLAVGSSICGASAVVATAQVTQAKEEETSLALMGLLGTVGVLFYVLCEPLLGLSAGALGILSGATLHEVAQVMAAAFTWGTASGEMGIMVKLIRVVLLAPVLLGLGFFFKQKRGLTLSWREPPIPYFVVGFLAMGILNSIGVFSPFIQQSLTQTSLFLMTMAMAAQGLLTDWQQVWLQGRTALVVGGVGFTVMAILAYAWIAYIASLARV